MSDAQLTFWISHPQQWGVAGEEGPGIHMSVHDHHHGDIFLCSAGGATTRVGHYWRLVGLVPLFRAARLPECAAAAEALPAVAPAQLQRVECSSPGKLGTGRLLRR